MKVMDAQHWVGTAVCGTGIIVLCTIASLAGGRRVSWRRQNWLPTVLCVYFVLTVTGLALIFGSFAEGVVAAITSLILAIPTALAYSARGQSPR